MGKKSLWELIGAWFKARYKIIILYILLMGIYQVVGILSHLELSALTYSAYLFSFIGICISVLDIRKYIKTYQALLDTNQNKMMTLEHLPKAHDLIEAVYQEIMLGIHEEMQSVKAQMRRQAADANDYYTLWAHQIKTPIAAMHLLLQSKAYNGSSLALEQELFKIEQYAEMALQYLRLESISSDLDLRSYHLYDIVAQALKKYAIRFIGKKISLEFEPFEETVITDEKWLQFVIEQILSNSIKYTPEGKISIRMENPQTLVISDTGIGIHTEDLPRIFDRGFTGYNGRMDKKSTGIGLYLCKKVTKKLSHDIKVTSKIGEGTSVYIIFKRVEE